jgi:hypothetical protein
MNCRCLLNALVALLLAANAIGVDESCSTALVAILLAEGPSATLVSLQRAAASVWGLASHACVCAASDDAYEHASLLASNQRLAVLRITSGEEAGYRNECLRTCLSSQPANCASHTYALPLEPGSLILLMPGEALPDTSHTGVPEQHAADVRAALEGALAGKQEGYILRMRLADTFATTISILRADVPWNYDAVASSWRGGIARDLLHNLGFAMRIENALYFGHLSRFEGNEVHFASRLNSNPQDFDALFFLAQTLYDAGRMTEALPLFERFASIVSGTGASIGSRDMLFVSRMHMGRIHADRGRMGLAEAYLLAAAETLPARRVEAMRALADRFRVRLQPRKALGYALAAVEARKHHARPPDSALFVNEDAYASGPDLEVYLNAYNVGEPDALVEGVQALLRLLALASLDRFTWLVSFDNAEMLIDRLSKVEPVPPAAERALAALAQARQPRPVNCTPTLVILDSAPQTENESACGKDSVFGRKYSGVAVIEMPSRSIHVEHFVRSLGCTQYLRIPAVMHLTPAELRRDHNPKLRGGEMRLIQAHTCALQIATSLPPGSAPLAIFEDDVAPLRAHSMPLAAHLLQRMASSASRGEADVLLLGRCPCKAENPELPADEMVSPPKFACAHAYAVTPIGAATLAADVRGPMFRDAFDMSILHLAESGRLRVRTNAGASLFLQTHNPSSLNAHEEKGMYGCQLPILGSSSHKPLKITVVGGWAHDTMSIEDSTSSELWLIGFILQNITGRAIQIVSAEHVAEADVVLLSVFAERAHVEAAARHRAVSVFLVGENTLYTPLVGHNGAVDFADHLLPLADVSLGHRTDLASTNTKYMRFPWWVPTALVRRSAATSLDSVSFHPALRRLTNVAAWSARPEFALFVNGHASHPREQMVSFATKVGQVHSPGRALNNMNWPADVPNTLLGKLELGKRYRFILCPENSRTADGGYVTEKLPQAHLMGAVPVYWGDAPVADSSVWNMGRVLLFNDTTENSELRKLIEQLETDDIFRATWFEQPVLAPTADAWLDGFLGELKSKLAAALASKGVTNVIHDPPAGNGECGLAEL